MDNKNMDSIFNESFYRFYLENFWPMDEEKWTERKSKIDELSEEYLQKVVDDSRFFCVHLIEELNKNMDSESGSVYAEIECQDQKCVKGDLQGNNCLDILINPCGYEKDFYVSKRLLDMFFGYCVTIESIKEEGGLPVLKIAMPLKQFMHYEDIIIEDTFVRTRKPSEK